LFLPITIPAVVKADDPAAMGSLEEDAMTGENDKARK